MKIVDVPAPVTVNVVVNDGGVIKEVSQKMSFFDFLKVVFKGHKAFSQGPDMARLYNKLVDIVEAAEKAYVSDGKDNVVRFEDADFKTVKEAVTGAGWASPDVNRACLPFYDATDKAQDVKA